MLNDVIVDAGPLIAIFDRDDQHHEYVHDWFPRHHFRSHTTFSVVAEVAHVLSFQSAIQIGFLQWIQSGALLTVDLTAEDLDRSIEILVKYADLPADFADATLVAVAERLGVRDVLTLDGDFRIYRYRNRSNFRLPLLDS